METDQVICQNVPRCAGGVRLDREPNMMRLVKAMGRMIALGVALPAAAAVTPQSSVPDLVFASPSGNIRCVLAGEIGVGVRCDLAVARQSYTARPRDCAGDWGRSFAVGPTGPGRLICVTDAVAGDEMRVLPYGGLLSYGGVTCRSEESGMTCTSDEGGGFRLRRSEQRIF